MAKCIHCKKGKQYGHHVSHAKNRVKRVFKPNIQKYKVSVNGITKRVKLCTKCIKRIKNFGRLGVYTRIAHLPLPAVVVDEVKVKLPDVKVEEKKIAREEEDKETEKKKEKLQIEDIVGKKE